MHYINWMVRRFLYPVLTWLAIVATNAAAAYWLGLPVQRFVSGIGLIALVGGIVAWWMSRDIATWGMVIRPIDEFAEPSTVQALKTAMERLCQAYGLKRPPAIGYYESDEVNALAVGRTRRQAILALSTGLLRQLAPEQRDAVIAQELALIASGDAITFPLVHGQIQAFTLFPARMLALLLGTALRTAEEETPSDPVETLVVACLEICVTPLGSLLARQFQRSALSRADRKAASIVGRETMLATLQTLSQTAQRNINRDKFCAPLKISAAAPSKAWPLSFHLPFTRRQARL